MVEQLAMDFSVVADEPPRHDLKALIRAEHRRAELERLRAGYEGCGCAGCQDFYPTINLWVYGDRVKRYAGVISIVEGRPGADFWEKYHRELRQDAANMGKTGGEVVSKIPDKDILPTGDIQAQDNGIMKHRGRPQKSGEVSRTTAWRRRKDGLAS